MTHCSDDCRDPLDYGRPGHRNFALLEGDHGQHRKGVEQFAGAQQEIGVVRASEPLVAAREGLVDQDPPLSLPRKSALPGFLFRYQA